MKKIINHAIVFTCFGSGFVLTQRPVDIYLSYIILIIFFIYYIAITKNIIFHKYFLILLFFLSFFSVVNIFIGNNSILLFLKQFLGIGFSGTVYYYFLKYNRFEFNKIFRIYIKFAFFIAIIGIFQEISYLLNFEPGYNYQSFIPNFKITETNIGLLRINSILPEPAHFAASIIPASFISIHNLFNYKDKPFFINRAQSIIIAISLVLSLSTIAFIGIIFIIFLIVLNYRKILFIIIGTVIAAIFSITIYLSIPDVKMRVDDTFSAITENNFQLRDANWSSFAILSNSIIAYQVFKTNPFFGFGLGSHPITYDKYIEKFVNIYDPEMVFLNRTDACSLFLRLISETGFFGIFILFFFIIKNYVSRNKNNSLWIISNAILALFFLNIIRQGHYFYNGFWLFIWIYYYISKTTILPKSLKLNKKIC